MERERERETENNSHARNFVVDRPNPNKVQHQALEGKIRQC